MSLEELKKNWDALASTNNINTISSEQVQAAFKSKYRSFSNRMLLFDAIILLIYLYFMAFTIAMFDRLEIGYLEVLGIVSIVLLFTLSVLRVLQLYRTFSNRSMDYSHSIVLEKLAKQSIKKQQYYLSNIVLGFVLVVILIVLNVKVYNEYDLIQSSYFWLSIIPGSLMFIVLLNTWMRNYYWKIIKESEELIQELDD